MIRMMQWNEVPLLVEGGREFFAEGKMAGGWDEAYFVKTFTNLMKNGVARLAGTFGADGIHGALAWMVHPGLFSPVTFATEVFWFMRPAYRGRDGVRLFNYFEDWAQCHGPLQVAMIHLMDLQPEKLGAFYLSRGFRLVEQHYVKEIL